MARDLPMNYVRIGSLSVAKAFHEFIEQEAAPGTSLSAEAFWSGFAELLRECGARNRQLLQVRDELQSRIDQYHRERAGEPLDLSDYERFLRDIGYVLPEGDDFAIRTANVDDEIAIIAGPQLVVPLSNARYALNAANARWGSLYDALYGTDAIPEDGGATRTGTYNKIRGERVVAQARAMLDETVPLARGSHGDVISYSVGGANVLARLRDGTSIGLARPAQFAGYQGEASTPSAVLLRNHGLHLEIKIDRGELVGRDDPAGIADMVRLCAGTRPPARHHRRLLGCALKR
jgi:malate synthase